MNEVMTRDEMETRFQNEWLLIADPEVNEQFEVLRGTVLCHSKDRDEVYDKAIEAKLKASATLFIGNAFDHEEYLL